MAELTAEELRQARKMGLTAEQYAAAKSAPVDPEAERARMREGITNASIPQAQKDALLRGITHTAEATK